MDVQQAPIDVQDIYSWRATYSDGSHLDEEHAVGGFASVDLARCTHLALIDQSGNAAHVVEIPSGAQAVFFRRRRISVNVMKENSEPQATVHCIGWKRSEEDAVYLFVFANGTTLLSNDLQAG